MYLYGLMLCYTGAGAETTLPDALGLSEADIERQLEAGAFFMDPKEAIESGFIDPDNEPDTVIVDVRREES